MAEIIALAAMFIALGALVVSFWQGFLTRKHNRLSVRPHLTFERDLGDREDSFGIHVVNNGLGPAIYSAFTLTVDGGDSVRIENTIGWAEALSRAGLSGPFFFRFPEVGEALAGGGTIALLTCEEPASQGIIMLKEAIDRLTLTINYRSIYGETFTVAMKRPTRGLGTAETPPPQTEGS